MLFFLVLSLISLKGTIRIDILFAFSNLLTSESQFFIDRLKDCFRKGIFTFLTSIHMGITIPEQWVG